MNWQELECALQKHPRSFPRFVLPDGDYIPAHAHVTEIGHVVRNFIDCGGMRGKEEKIVLQTHVGSDVDHRLRADRLSKILRLGNDLIPNTRLEVDVEYDCCVVGQYPLAEARPRGQYLDLLLRRGRTQCRARERSDADTCCTATAACC